MQESSLKWYGHVLRREDEYVGKKVMAMEVPGKRRRGRPKHQERLVGENCQCRMRKTEASHKTHRPHIKVGENAEEED